MDQPDNDNELDKDYATDLEAEQHDDTGQHLPAVTDPKDVPPDRGDAGPDSVKGLESNG